MLGRLLTLVIFALFAMAKYSYAAQALPAHQHKRVPELKVLVAKAEPLVTVSGLDLKRDLHLGPGNQRSWSGRKQVKFKCRRFFSKLPNVKEAELVASLSSGTGLLGLKEEKFKGKIHVYRSEKGDGCDVVNEITLEDYLPSLLSKEMNATWELEALKAQAIAARTYAYYKLLKQDELVKHGKDQFFDLENSEKHQVSGHFFDGTMKTHQAVRETRGMILVDKKGKVTPTFFHAKCGGKTFRPSEVWANPVSGYRNISDPYCHKRGGKHGWNTKVSRNRFVKFLNYLRKRGDIISSREFKSSDRIRMVPDNEKKKTVRLYIGSNAYTFSKTRLRRYFGRVEFPSNNFSFKIGRGFLKVKGFGNGHGVGMCQVGAQVYATKGGNVRDILSHYFPGHHLKKIY